MTTLTAAAMFPVDAFLMWPEGWSLFGLACVGAIWWAWRDERALDAEGV